MRIMPSSVAPWKKPGFRVRIEKRIGTRLLVQSRRKLHDHLVLLRLDREHHAGEMGNQKLPASAADHDYVVAPGREHVRHLAQMLPRGGPDAQPDQLEPVVRA